MRRLGRALAVLLLLVVAGGVTFYERPLWVERQWTHLGLFFSHVQSNYVLTAQGYRVHYYEGEPRGVRNGEPGGLPLVLIHGLGDRDESWAPMLERMRRAGFHVYAPDLLGYGRSPKPADGDYSVSGQEQYVAGFIEALGLQKPNVGGWSMGGWIALKLALDHPEMVNRVVVYDSAGLRLEPGAAEPDKGAAALFSPRTPADINRLLLIMEPEAKPLPDFVARDAVRKFNSDKATIDRNVASAMTGNDLLNDRVGQLPQPLLIVWGADDHLLPLATGQALHGMVKSSELDIVEGCGHLAPLRCPGRVAAATADFLRSNPPPNGEERRLTRMR